MMNARRQSRPSLFEAEEGKEGRRPEYSLIGDPLQVIKRRGRKRLERGYVHFAVLDVFVCYTMSLRE